MFVELESAILMKHDKIDDSEIVREHMSTMYTDYHVDKLIDRYRSEDQQSQED